MAFIYKGKEYFLSEMEDILGDVNVNTLAIFRVEHYDHGTNTILDNPTQQEIDKLVDEGRYEYRFTFINYFWYGGDYASEELEDNLKIAEDCIDSYMEAHNE